MSEGRVQLGPLCVPFLALLAVVGALALWLRFSGGYDEGASTGGSIDVSVPHEVEVSDDAVPRDIPFCYAAYRVRDRQSGMEWLILVMSEGTNGNEYVTLPIGDAR